MKKSSTKTLSGKSVKKPAKSSSGKKGKASQEQGEPVSLPPGSSPYQITLRYLEKDAPVELQLSTTDRDFYPVAQQWRYIVANRRRIMAESRDTLSRDIFDRMVQLTQADAESLLRHVQAMAVSRWAEVEIPYAREEEGWAARLFPWENVLSHLTRPHREKSGAFTVLRTLALQGARPPVAELPQGLLIVRSSPGDLGKLYDLETECEMVRDALRSLVGAGEDPVLENPDRTSLEARLLAGSPAVLHLAGVDPLALGANHLASLEGETTDGFVLRGTSTPYDCVNPIEMGRLLARATHPPLLVALSSCYSALRVAPMMVAHGARHAIGFQDSVSDADVLFFFSTFYRSWSQSWDTLKAFEEARLEFSRQASAPATAGVVLWSDHSWLKEAEVMRSVQEMGVPGPLTAGVVPAAQPSDVRLYVESSPNLNYSLLHNNRSPFKTFQVEKPFPGTLPPLRIEVALEVGGEVCRCRFAEPLPSTSVVLNLVERIRLPLVAGLLRQCNESLRTNLYVRVECGEVLLREQSERVTILPADEWRDDGEDHRWLPCFVLPRDPSVLRVICAAQRYLRTLLDDCNAGFDGYQRLAPDDSNAAEVLDPQVQAIWAALQHDLPLNYINPPPSYSSQSQRLRSPGQIFEGGAATCIDLALLFGSCLEFVGIYPVLFLITGHAFPGYWRSDKAWWRMRNFFFRDTHEPVLANMAGMPGPANPQRQGEGWMFEGVDNLRELLCYVQNGSLVPFESTYVTRHRGFFEALEAGPGLLHPDTFDVMIDIQLARGENVTPIPLLEKRG